MDYIELTVTVSPREPFTEILISALADDGFESFVETESGFQAYIQSNLYKEGMEKQNWAWQLDGLTIHSETRTIPRQNWNAKWEQDFEPILVDDQVYIYAPFHPAKTKIPYQLLIEPKMSFGTGHHQTTHLVVQYLLELNCEGKRILDMGCGTGVLAILAAKRGATDVVGIDIDEWAVENSAENAERNNVQLAAILGDAKLIPKQPFDVVLANINKNVLLADMNAYAAALKPGGEIVFSGFYTHDLEDLTAAAKNVGLDFVSKKERDNWQAAHFVKTGE
jgi:ribosomal protein L11 methyltransferase